MDTSSNYRFKQVRKFFNLNQAEFAKKLGITQAAVSKIESGKMDLSIETIKKLNVLLNIDISWLVSNKTNSTEIIFEENKQDNQINLITEDQKYISTLVLPFIKNDSIAIELINEIEKFNFQPTDLIIGTPSSLQEIKNSKQNDIFIIITSDSIFIDHLKIENDFLINSDLNIRIEMNKIKSIYMYYGLLTKKQPVISNSLEQRIQSLENFITSLKSSDNTSD